MLDYKYSLLSNTHTTFSILTLYRFVFFLSNTPLAERRRELDDERFSGNSHIDVDDTETSSRVRFFINSRFSLMNPRRVSLSARSLLYLLLGMTFISVVSSDHGMELRDDKSHRNMHPSDVKIKDRDISSSSSSSLHHRKILRLSPPEKLDPERIGEKCKRSDIVVNQAPSEPMPNGIPGYTVEITNECMSGCKISRIHVSCGWFSSAKLINPRVFKRIHYDDCLVNNGKPLPYGSTISFHYANTFPYPLSVSFVTCL